MSRKLRQEACWSLSRESGASWERRGEPDTEISPLSILQRPNAQTLSLPISRPGSLWDDGGWQGLISTIQRCNTRLRQYCMTEHTTAHNKHTHAHACTKGHFGGGGGGEFFCLFFFFSYSHYKRKRARSGRTDEGTNKYYKNITICKYQLNPLSFYEQGRRPRLYRKGRGRGRGRGRGASWAYGIV